MRRKAAETYLGRTWIYTRPNNCNRDTRCRIRARATYARLCPRSSAATPRDTMILLSCRDTSAATVTADTRENQGPRQPLGMPRPAPEQPQRQPRSSPRQPLKRTSDPMATPAQAQYAPWGRPKAAPGHPQRWAAPLHEQREVHHSRRQGTVG